MADLTPELRMDKTGKMVTRWVKKNSPDSKGQSIPRPTTQRQNGLPVIRKRTINRAAKLLAIHGYYDSVSESKEYISEFLSKYNDVRTFDIINAALDRDPKLIVDVERITSDYPERDARERIHFMDYMGKYVSPNSSESDELFLGLRDYEEFAGVDDFTTLEGDDHRAVAALLQVGSFTIGYLRKEDSSHDLRPNRYSIADDQKLVDAILGNLDRTDEIMEFMTSRRVFDGEAVNAYLNEHKALNDGFL